jgi:signal peptidase I
MSSQNGRAKARAIEQIVRAQLLLVAVILCVIAAFLVAQGSVLALVGVAAVGAGLVGVARLLATVPLRELADVALKGLVVAAAAVFVALAVLPHFGWYRPVTVLSGSMRPTFSPGDLIIARPEPLHDVRVGQVISYYVPLGGRPLETHRVIRILHGGANPVVQTQGDANNWRDPWTAKLHGRQAWRLSLVVPHAGYVVNALRGRTLHIAAVIVAPALILLLFLGGLWNIPVPRRLGHARS